MSYTRLLRAELAWLSGSIASKARKYLLMPFQSVEVSGESPRVPIRIEKNVPISMRDDVRLYADIYLPKASGRYPAIMTRLPYGKSGYSSWIAVYGRFWARRGYAFVAQDVRGKFKSEGDWDPFVNEVNDGHATIEWISQQPWCDGNIGAIGESYMGYTCWAAGLSGHPNLKCIAPGMTATDVYGVWAFRRGAFCLQTMSSWVIPEESRKSQNYMRLDPWTLPLGSLGDSAGLRSSQYMDWLRHPWRDSSWDRMNLHDRLKDISVPVLHMGGWLDVFLEGTLDDWERVKAASNREASSNQWLVLGPNDHGSTTNASRRLGRVDLGPAEPDPFYDRIKDFFDCWLKGADNGFGGTPRVRYFVIGENAWREDDAWPPPGIRPIDYYLHSNGDANTLNGNGILSTVPQGAEPADGYVYDPRNPATVSLDSDLWNIARHLNDRRSVERRDDVLVYTSSELKQDTEITGPITATIFASTSAIDTDFMVTLVDVFPDGYAQMIQEGVVRASYRRSDREPSMVQPNEAQEYRISLRSTSYVVKKGHSIRIEVTSSDFNRYNRNLNTGEEIGVGTSIVTAHQQVFHDEGCPSRVTLPLASLV
ncbi:MAG: CocE/NonD family hydrolase [Thermoplasmata archaeon]|nr:CocE/NonD family hydrolase [Thermoplasmata archaeon]